MDEEMNSPSCTASSGASVTDVCASVRVALPSAILTFTVPAMPCGIENSNEVMGSFNAFSPCGM